MIGRCIAAKGEEASMMAAVKEATGDGLTAPVYVRQIGPADLRIKPREVQQSKYR